MVLVVLAPAAPAGARSNGAIAFEAAWAVCGDDSGGPFCDTHGRAVFAYGPGGSPVRRLNRPLLGTDAEFSRDGRWIAVATDAGVLIGAGSMRGLAEPVPSTDDAFSVAWSPGGTRLALARFNPAGEPTIDIVGKSGRKVRTLGAGRWPAWSATRWIAFAANDEIRIARQSGASRRLVKARFGGPASLSWSPDGNTLAVEGAQDVGGTCSAPRICLVDLSRREVRTLRTGTDEFGQGDIAWAPDGRSIARSSSAGIYRVRVDGGGARRLVDAERLFPRSGERGVLTSIAWLAWRPAR